MNIKNRDMTASPFSIVDEGWYEGGLSKREYAAIHLPSADYSIDSTEALVEFIGREVDVEDTVDMMKAGAEAEAKVRQIYADALFDRLEKTQ